MQNLVSTIAYKQPATADTCMSRDSKFIQHKGFVVEVARLVSGIQKMSGDLEAQLYGLTGGKEVGYTLPKNHVDDLSSTARGMSWMDRCKTMPRDQGLMYHMIKEGLWNMSVLTPEGGLSWNRVACQEFMDRAAKIVDLIIMLIHLGVGPPVRGEELVQDQITNGVQIRTIYVTFGQMLAIRRRSKTNNARGIDAFNICYFPQRLTHLICYYLLVVRPLERLVAWELYKDRKKCLDYDLYLYVKHGKRMTSEQFSTTLRVHTGKYIGVKLSINPMRHIMIAFMRAFLEPVMIQKGNNIGDLMSSHNSVSGNHYYARQIGNLEGVTDLLMHDVREFCDSYHDAIGLGERRGPLIAIRIKRQIAQKLVLAASMDAGDPGMIGAIGELLNNLGEIAFRAGLQELRSQVTQEIWQAVAEGLERVLSDIEPSQPPARPARVSHDLPSTSTLESAPALRFEGLGHKRGLSGKNEPRPKRKAPETPETNRQRSDSGTVYPQHQEAPELEDPFDMQDIAATPRTPAPAPSTRLENETPKALPGPDAGSTGNIFTGRWMTPDPISPTTPTFPPDAEREVQVTTALEKLSTMTLGLHSEQDQPGQPPPTEEAPPTQEEIALPEPIDPKLTALRRYRKDPNAQFRGKQRELLDSMSRHTIAVLPTGSGKSVAYELPPLYDGRITIVGVPFRLVVNQVLANAERRGLMAEVWLKATPKIIKDGLRLIVVPYDTLLTETFAE